MHGGLRRDGGDDGYAVLRDEPVGGRAGDDGGLRGVSGGGVCTDVSGVGAVRFAGEEWAGVGELGCGGVYGSFLRDAFVSQCVCVRGRVDAGGVWSFVRLAGTALVGGGRSGSGGAVAPHGAVQHFVEFWFRRESALGGAVVRLRLPAAVRDAFHDECSDGAVDPVVAAREGPFPGGDG